MGEGGDILQNERIRYQYYSFLRKNKKPKKGEDKVIVFNHINEEESLDDYFNRCHNEKGAKPSPIGPIKKIKPNIKCPCESGKKYKNCHGRAE